MLEYSFLLGNNIRDAWSGQFLPLLDKRLNSNWFWPDIAITALTLVILTRLIAR